MKLYEELGRPQSTTSVAHVYLVVVEVYKNRSSVDNLLISLLSYKILLTPLQSTLFSTDYIELRVLLIYQD